MMTQNMLKPCFTSSELFAQPKRAPMSVPTPLQKLSMIYCMCDIPFTFQSDEVKPENWSYGTLNDISTMQNEPRLLSRTSKDSKLSYSESKEEMYFQLLAGYKYSTITTYDPNKSKDVIEYKCGYQGCGKVLQKPWNLLDHVRMHEGVKPYKCQWCGKGFTQKGNLKKHSRQHINPNVNARKRYSCRLCGKGYTERYNLKVSLFIISLTL